MASIQLLFCSLPQREQLKISCYCIWHHYYNSAVPVPKQVISIVLWTIQLKRTCIHHTVHIYDLAFSLSMHTIFHVQAQVQYRLWSGKRPPSLTMNMMISGWTRMVLMASSVSPIDPATNITTSKAHISKQIMKSPGTPSLVKSPHSLRLSHVQPPHVFRWRLRRRV